MTWKVLVTTLSQACRKASYEEDRFSFHVVNAIYVLTAPYLRGFALVGQGRTEVAMGGLGVRFSHLRPLISVLSPSGNFLFMYGSQWNYGML